MWWKFILTFVGGIGFAVAANELTKPKEVKDKRGALKDNMKDFARNQGSPTIDDGIEYLEDLFEEVSAELKAEVPQT